MKHGTGFGLPWGWLGHFIAFGLNDTAADTLKRGRFAGPVCKRRLKEGTIVLKRKSACKHGLHVNNDEH